MCMPAGRPSKYNPAMCDMLEGMGHEGEGKAEAALELGICRDTFNEWERKHPGFSDAVKRFVFRSQAWWEKQGRLGTFGLTEGFNATGYVFNMKNRFGDDWKDKRENEVSGNLTIKKASVEFIDGPES